MTELADRLARRIASAAARPLVVGLTGPQGSGKSTLAAQLAPRLAARGVQTAVLALDDLYLPRTDRLRMAADIHPLLATRGVPGTHDVALGLEVLASLTTARRTRVPRFDKGADDRRPGAEWPVLEAHVDAAVAGGGHGDQAISPGLAWPREAA